MNRRRLEITLIVLSCFTLALVGFHALIDIARRIEIRGVITTLDALGLHRVSAAPRSSLQVLPDRGLPFRAQITPFCSALISVLTLACIALFILRAPLWKRIGALLVAATLVSVCNVVRIVASVYVGIRFGSASLALFHDWVGTVASFLYTLGGFFLMLSLLLPSAKDEKLVRAVRLSDAL